MSGTTPAGPTLRVALGEYDTGWHDPARSLQLAAELTGRAARAGARLVVLPEMATTGFTMDAGRATPLEGDDVARLASIARDHATWLIAGVALRDEATARPANAAVTFGPDGEVRAVYRKRRLFTYSGEHDHYAPGAASTAITIDGVRVAPFICYELRFPELFRAAAAEADVMVLIANWPASRRLHWDVLARARAIENQCWFVAVNRTGAADRLVYDGGSAAYDPWGEPAPGVGRDPLVVEVDAGRVAAIRERYPFLRDR